MLFVESCLCSFLHLTCGLKLYLQLTRRQWFIVISLAIDQKIIIWKFPLFFWQSSPPSLYFFSSTNIEHPKRAGSAGGKWKQLLYFTKIPPKNYSTNKPTYDCSSTEGPTSETLPFAQTASNISDISKGCDCFQTTKFSIETSEAPITSHRKLRMSWTYWPIRSRIGGVWKWNQWVWW